MADSVTIIETGVGNTASVVAAFGRLGISCERSRNAEAVARARAVVMPGVGAFGPGLDALRSEGLDAVVKDRISRGSPVLAVCLGLQMLCESSAESPGAHGLSILPAAVTRIVPGPDERLPHMGWNRIDANGPLVRSGHAYYAHSFRIPCEGFTPPAGWSIGTTDYSGRFVASLERGPVLACQFHPELSGSWGLGLLARWAAQAGFRPVCSNPEDRPC